VVVHALFVLFRPHHGAPLTCNRHIQTEVHEEIRNRAKVCPVLPVLKSDSDIGPVRKVPAFTWITGLRSCRPFCILLFKTSLKTYVSMPEKRRYTEAAESDDELPLTQRAAVQVTKRPTAAILPSQAEPRVVKVHKSSTSTTQSKQSTRRDLLTVLGKKPTPTAKAGVERLCEEKCLVWRQRPPMCMVPCTLVSKGSDQVSWRSLPGSDAAERAQTGQREDVLQGVLCRGPSLCSYWLQSLARR
jgi:hypothetical protein